MKNFSLVIPVYNEEFNIVNLYEEINQILDNNMRYEIIFIDDGSTDNTRNEIINLKNDPKVTLYENEKNLGQSYSIFKGIKNSKNDTIVTLDGDGQNDPNDILKLLNLYNSNQKIKLVGGIRVNRKDTKLKKISSIIANKVRSYFLKDKCPDTGCALKVFSKEIFLTFEFFNGIHRFLPSLFIGAGYECEYIDVNHRYRTAGYSKYGVSNRLFKGILDIIKVKKMIKKL